MFETLMARGAVLFILAVTALALVLLERGYRKRRADKRLIADGQALEAARSDTEDAKARAQLRAQSKWKDLPPETYEPFTDDGNKI